MEVNGVEVTEVDPANFNTGDLIYERCGDFFYSMIIVDKPTLFEMQTDAVDGGELNFWHWKALTDDRASSYFLDLKGTGSKKYYRRVVK